MDDKRTIGWVGLGKMGLPMARNLSRANYELFVFDKRLFDDSDSLHEELEMFGAREMRSLGELGERAGITWTMIPHTETENVVGEIAHGMSKSADKGIVIDGGNSDPRVSKRIAAKLQSEYGLDFLDAGCAGGVESAAKGELAIMAGGRKEAYDKALPVLKLLGKPEYMGPSGSGHYAKMVHNCLEQIYMMGIGEITSFAKELGLNPKKTAIVINRGLCQSKLLELYIQIPENEIENTSPYLSGGDYSRMAVEISNEKDFPLPFTGLTYELRKLSRTKDYETFSIQAQLRKKFGGHEVYKKSG